MSKKTTQAMVMRKAVVLAYLAMLSGSLGRLERRLGGFEKGEPGMRLASLSRS